MGLRLAEVVIDCADHETVVAFWLAAMEDYERHDVNEQYVGIAPRERAIGRPTILFQKVPEPKMSKNRVHLDLRADARLAEVQRLLGLGATFVADGALGPSTRWTVMADPEGNEFCVTGPE